MGRDLPKLVVVLGPTASGKTELAIHLAKQYNGEIISADSRQVYREMNIGTNKPAFKDKDYMLGGVKHFLFDITSPNDIYNAARFKSDALHITEEILGRGKVPFLVGGTGLYISAIVDNLLFPPQGDAKRHAELDKMDNNALFAILIKRDPQYAALADPSNHRRIVRAVEVLEAAQGAPLQQARKHGKPLFNVLQIGLMVEPDVLDKRIDDRVEQMFTNGLVNEVQALVKKYNTQLPSMSGIAYGEVAQHLRGECTLDEAKALIKTHTRQYAKRQRTWFRQHHDIVWVHNEDEARQAVSAFLQ